MRKLKLFTLFTIAIGFMFSCKKKEEEETPEPAASFDIAFNLRGNVTLLNKSSDYSSSVWNFGDGSTTETTSQNGTPITHKYLSTGTFTITLKVTGEGGESSTSKQVTVSSLPVEASAIAKTAIEVGPTNIKTSFDLTAGSGVLTEFYLELSKQENFAVLEDVDEFSSGVQTELKIQSADDVESPLYDLTPSQEYFYRIRTEYQEESGKDKVITYSNVITATTSELPEPTIEVSEGETPYHMELKYSVSLSDNFATVDKKLTVATDENFTNEITLESTHIFDTYFREPGVKLYIKVTATVNGKTSEKIAEFDSSKDYYTGEASFNSLANSQVTLSNNNTRLLIGNPAGEHITYFFTSSVKEGDTFQVEKGEADPAKERVIYTDADGKEYQVANSGTIPTLTIYRITGDNAFVRWGSATNANTFMSFRYDVDPNPSRNFTLDGLVAKATIQ